ncbi:MAG: carboxypeptidase-like regulatory domain-containing protein, partial [Bacteroidota bacterium]
MRIVIIMLLVVFTAGIYAQNKSDANIFGHVVCGDEHIPYASIYVKGTSVGVASDETGHFQLINLPEGEFIIVAKALGYKQQEIKVITKAGETKEIKFNLVEDLL